MPVKHSKSAVKKIRLIFSVSTAVLVVFFAYFVSLYARGYRLNQKTLRIEPNGILVIKSDPDGAQVFIDGEFKTATNATLSLSPGTYDISIKKEGYIEWNKRLVIEREIVTETTAHIFKSVPSLSAATFSGATNPVPSPDMSKIAYVVPTIKNDNDHNSDNAGLWVMETVNLPLGFSRDPRRITDGDLSSAKITWSPNSQEILVTIGTGSYLIDTSRLVPQREKVNISSGVDDLLSEWETEKNRRLASQFKNLPREVADVLQRKSSSVSFSPDKDMVLYIASGSALLPDNLIKPLPGSSTQRQQREIKPGHTYVYDIKEDRNFLIDDHSVDLEIPSGFSSNSKRKIMWFPTSRHIVLAEDRKVIIMDNDGTNRKEVFSGSYVSPHAYSNVNISRLVILTNLGADSIIPNLYSLSLK